MENCTKFGQLTVSKIIKIVTTSCQILRLKCIKFDFGWGSAPHPLGELTALPQSPDPLFGLHPGPGVYPGPGYYPGIYGTFKQPGYLRKKVFTFGGIYLFTNKVITYFVSNFLKIS